MRVEELKIKDFKRIVEAVITPGDRSIVLIGGENDQGKSSALDSLDVLFSSAAAIPAEPVRHGAEQAIVEADIGAFVVRRMIKPDRRTTFKVVPKGQKKGLPAPQGVIDEFRGGFLDINSFLDASDAEQEALLRSLSGIDFSDLEQREAELRRERQEFYGQVTSLRKQADAAPVHGDAPDEPLVVKSLLTELGRKRRVNEENDELVEREELAKQHLDELEGKVDDLRRKLDDAIAECENTRQRYSELKERVIDLQYENLAEIEDKIAGAEAQNAKLADNQRAQKLQEDAERAERRYAKFTADIKAIGAEKDRLLAESPVAVRGLTFSESGGLRFKGPGEEHSCPLKQCSSSSQITVAVALGVVQSPRLRVLRITDGSLLGAKKLAMIDKMAEKYQAQVWIERVGDADEGAIIIEDGMVRS